MARLSILIPSDGGPEALERTLVSVLQNRPDACEIVVVTGGEYDDPYNLAGEVEFLTVPQNKGLQSQDPIERLQHGLQRCHAPVVHVLRAGLEATDRWTDAALAHFDDPTIAAVAPVVVTSNDAPRVLSAGFDYRAGGKTIVRSAGACADSLSNALEPITGPTLAAAFYRLEAIQRSSGRFAAGLNQESAQVDWALVLRQGGYRAVCEPSSRVLDDAQQAPIDAATARSAWQAERIFWRHAGGMGWTRSLAAHSTVVMAECLRHWSAPQVAVSRLAGMAVGCARAVTGRNAAIRNVATSEVAAPQPLASQPAALRSMHRTDTGNASPPAPRREVLEHAGNRAGNKV